MQARKEQSQKSNSLRLLIWTAVAGLIFGLLGAGAIVEDQLRVARNKLHMHEASGDIVILGGEGRLVFHGVDRIYPGTSTLLKNGGRINLTLRRVNI